MSTYLEDPEWIRAHAAYLTLVDKIPKDSSELSSRFALIKQMHIIEKRYEGPDPERVQAALEYLEEAAQYAAFACEPSEYLDAELVEIQEHLDVLRKALGLPRESA